MLKDECDTITVFVPPGCTSLVLPLVVVFNGPFKQAVDTLATSHMENILLFTWELHCRKTESPDD